MEDFNTAKPQNLEFGESDRPIAKGASGHVFRGKIQSPSSLIDAAIKKTKNTKSTDGEICALKRLGGHANVIGVLGVYSEGCFVYTVLSYCDCTLLKVAEMPFFTEKHYLILDITFQITSGLKHIHNAGIIHRDIKPANILLQWEGNKFVVKVADFGCCEHGTVSYKKSGTSACMSPENFISETHVKDNSALCHRTDFRTDYWSLGVTLYFLVTGKYPFINKHGRVSHVYSEWIIWLANLEDEMGRKESLFNRNPSSALRGISTPFKSKPVKYTQDILLMQLMDGLLSVQPFYRWSHRNIKYCLESLFPLDETFIYNMHKTFYDYINKI